MPTSIPTLHAEEDTTAESRWGITMWELNLIQMKIDVRPCTESQNEANIVGNELAFMHRPSISAGRGYL